MNSKERKCNPTFREGSFEILFKSSQQLTIPYFIKERVSSALRLKDYY